LNKLTLAILILIVGLTYIPSLQNQFTNWDDSTHLLNNSSLVKLDIDSIKKIFSKTVDKVYVPLTILSFAIEYHYFKLEPFIYHLNNVLLHLGVVLLIFFFGRRCGFSSLASGLAALVFGIHPMHVESVVWVTERKDVLYSLFYMLALLSYWGYLKENKISSFALTLLWGCLSVLAKPMALSLPLILLLCDWTYGRKINLRCLLEKAIHMVYIVPLVWITYSLHARVPGKNLLEAVSIWIWTFSFYIQKFFFPFTLIPTYKIPKPIVLWSWPYIFALTIFLLFVLVLVKFKTRRWVVFALVYYFASIFFLLRFDASVDLNIVADRFMYLPSMGICMLLGLMSEQFLEILKDKGTLYHRLGVYFIVLILGGLSLKTISQSRLWKNDMTLWSYVIEQNDKSFVAYNNRGLAYRKSQQYDLALNDYMTAISINPKHFRTYDNRGVLYVYLNKHELALADFNKSISIKSNNIYAINNRGVVYGMKGQLDRSLADFNRALQIDPDYAGSYFNRSQAYYQKKEFPMAYQDAVKAKDLGYTVNEQYINMLRDYNDKN